MIASGFTVGILVLYDYQLLKQENIPYTDSEQRCDLLYMRINSLKQKYLPKKESPPPRPAPPTRVTSRPPLKPIISEKRKQQLGINW